VVPPPTSFYTNNNTQMKRQRPSQSRAGRGGQRREVLSEDDYDATLSSIIQRDYFPESNALLHQNVLLDKRLNGDAIGAVEVRRAVRRLREQELEAETQRLEDDNDLVSVGDNNSNGTIVVADKASATTNSSRIRKRARPLGEETVTGFHARVTNEDDYEFESTQQESIEKNRKRLHGVFNDCQPGNARPEVKLQIEDELASDEFTAESNQLPASEWRSHSQTNNAFFFSPDGASLMPVDNDKEICDGDNTKNLAIENESSSDTASGLMLPPSRQQTQNMIVRRQGDPSSAATTKPPAKHELVEYIPKNVLEEKMIDPSQTRFPQSDDGRSIIPGYYNHQNSSSGGGGIVNLSSSSHGTDISDTDESMSVTDASQYGTDLDAPLRSIEEERKSRDRHIGKGYTGNIKKIKKDNKSNDPNYRPFVPMTPLNHPGTTASSSTSLKDGGLDHSSSARSTFTLSEESQREQAARHAEEELSRRARRAKQASSSSSSSRRKRKELDDMSIASSSTVYSSKQKPQSLTPAAMALLGKAASSKVRGRDEFSRSLRRSYTPKLSSSASSRSVTSSSVMSSSRQRSSSTSRPSHGSSKRDHAFNATPLTSRNGSK